ncbi:hypothetical protein [Cohnella sp. REN36]|uniref:hypothetical protein n=1 Tax=Cohnella sp. REN36 TaxID=2887347 RepID=UPI001D13A9CB|nr:hypothetical protein [Cohnella sp. REN36]MCC3372656.1 hypothetical protein [Cohnella sp. REN36]
MNAVLEPYLLGWKRTGHLRDDVPSFFVLHGDKEYAGSRAEQVVNPNIGLSRAALPHEADR